MEKGSLGDGHCILFFTASFSGVRYHGLIFTNGTWDKVYAKPNVSFPSIYSLLSLGSLFHFGTLPSFAFLSSVV